MYQLKWANRKLWTLEKSKPFGKAAFNRNDIKTILNVIWEEHCLECAWPNCYSSCELYVKRPDYNCSRLVYGIVPNYNFKGHYNFGADIKFRKWGKLEAKLDHVETIRLLPIWLYNLFKKLPLVTINLIERRLTKKVVLQKNTIDDFIIELYSVNEEEFFLVLEYFTEVKRLRTTHYRNSFKVVPGYNFFRIAFKEMHIEELTGYVYLYPESNLPEKRLIFTWLDFVSYKRPVSKETKAAEKIKCVIWDLDNTIWHGILSEESQVILNPLAVKTIQELDKKGIIQSITSKNDFQRAWDMLKVFHIEHYFLYPAINWGQKSENIRSIVKNLNIDLNTVAVVDDSDFERKEIRTSLPNVRVYTDSEIGMLTGYEEFDVPVTTASQLRRQSYLANYQRDIIKARFNSSYDNFLVECKMILDVYRLVNNNDKMRCWELIQRTNQLNLTTKRYTISEFEHQIVRKDYLTLSIKCKDRFGDYGIIGTACIELRFPRAILTDFVLSCRIAQKKVEHHFLWGLKNYLSSKGFQELEVILIRTEKNGPLMKVFFELPFEIVSCEDQDKVSLRLILSEKLNLKETLYLNFKVD